jgi:glycolate oxidase iron-sulfur subunit
MKSSQPKVLYYAGCLTQRFYPEIGRASVNVLRKNNVPVVMQKEKCCGIQALAAGDEEGARRLARWNIESFMREKVDAIVTSCPTCGMVVREYPWLFRNEGGEILNKAVDVSQKIYDFTDFLVNKIEFTPLDARVCKKATYHDPCHLNYAQRVSQEPRKLIKSIKGMEFVEMKRPDLCCGFGGFFSIEHFDLSAKINDRLLDQILDTKAELVIDACPPCILKLREGLRRRKIKGVEVRHVAEVLSEAAGGRPPQAGEAEDQRR